MLIKYCRLGGEDKSRLWPKNSNGISSIGYCFEDETAQNDLSNYISKVLHTLTIDMIECN